MKDFLLNQLECFKDPLFIFDSEQHRYTYDGEDYESVTKFVGKFHLPFDTESMSKKKADELGIDQETIKKEWAETNRYANEIGSATHEWIEYYFKGIWKPLPTNPDIIHRINKFNKIYSKHLHKLDPIASEIRVFSKKLKLAGTIDALFMKDDKLYILDYKTNKKFTDDNHKDGKYQKLLWPFDSYYKNHHNEYSIQLSLYATILEEWGIKVDGSFLVYIGPDDDDSKIIKIRDLRDEIKTFFRNKSEKG